MELISNQLKQLNLLVIKNRDFFSNKVEELKKKAESPKSKKRKKKKKRKS